VNLILRVYSQRRGNVDNYDITFNEKGWDFSNGKAHRGTCDQEGNPHLYNAFKQDYITYPEGLKRYLGSLWEIINNNPQIPQEEIQTYLHELSEWLIRTEKEKPVYPADNPKWLSIK